MELTNDYNLLVIVGNWNKYILSPEWVKEHLLPNDDFTVEVLIGANGSNRYNTKDLRFIIIDDKLMFSILRNEGEVYEKIYHISSKLADYLPHTPVRAFGINFIFNISNIPKLIDLFNFFDHGVLLKKGIGIDEQEIKRSIKFSKYVLNYTIKKNNEKYIIDFNYNFPIKSLKEYKTLMENNTINSFLNKSKELITEIYYEGNNNE